MQKNLFNFFAKSDTYDLPSKWLSDPLPPAAKKRCVGRPRKVATDLAEKPREPAADSAFSAASPAEVSEEPSIAVEPSSSSASDAEVLTAEGK